MCTMSNTPLERHCVRPKAHGLKSASEYWSVPRKIDPHQIASAPQRLPLGAWHVFCYLREVVGDRLWTDAELEQVPSMCVQSSRCVDFMLEQVGQAAHHLE